MSSQLPSTPSPDYDPHAEMQSYSGTPSPDVDPNASQWTFFDKKIYDNKAVFAYDRAALSLVLGFAAIAIMLWILGGA